MKLFKIMLALSVVFALGACSSKFKTYNGPEVTRVVVMKADRKMYVWTAPICKAFFRFGMWLFACMYPAF